MKLQIKIEKNFRCNGVQGLIGKELSEKELAQISEKIPELQMHGCILVAETEACASKPEAEQVVEAPKSKKKSKV